MNRRAEVVRCLRSLLAQTYSDAEIIFFDNRSSDGTAHVIAEQFPQVRLLPLTKMGAEKSRAARHQHPSWSHVRRSRVGPPVSGAPSGRSSAVGRVSGWSGEV